MNCKKPIAAHLCALLAWCVCVCGARATSLAARIQRLYGYAPRLLDEYALLEDEPPPPPPPPPPASPRAPALDAARDAHHYLDYEEFGRNGRSPGPRAGSAGAPSAAAGCGPGMAPIQFYGRPPDWLASQADGVRPRARLPLRAASDNDSKRSDDDDDPRKVPKDYIHDFGPGQRPFRYEGRPPQWPKTNESDLHNVFFFNETGPQNYSNPYYGDYVASCYVCGSEGRPPQEDACHSVFEGGHTTAYRFLRYRIRYHCHYNPRNREHIYIQRPAFAKYPGLMDRPANVYYKYWIGQEFDDLKVYPTSMIKNSYGSFIGGCYKRFVDISGAYTQRGCRQWPPGPALVPSWLGGFASHRFRRLEAALGRAPRDACVFSPHASLTPFSRSVSLFARYHVCVCRGRFCNRASSPPPPATRTLMLYYILTLLVFN